MAKHRISEAQRQWLRVIAAAEDHYRERNAKRTRNRIRDHEPEGATEMPNRTLKSLARHGFAVCSPHPTLKLSYLWTITAKGREALDG